MAQGVTQLPAPGTPRKTPPMAGAAAEAPALEGEAAAVSQLTNLNDINRLLNETLGRERAVDVELEGMLAKRRVIEGSLATLQSSTAEVLEVVTADAEGLAGSVKNTRDLSERVSVKVRELDSAQSHVRATLASIKVIVDRTNCIYGVRDAMAREDYEAGAEFVDTFLTIEEGHAITAVAADSAQAAEQAQILLSAKEKLGEVVTQRLTAAIAAGQHDEVVRFTKLCKPLRMQEAGLQAFTRYLRHNAAARAQQGYNGLVEGGDGGQQDDYAGALTALFRDIAVAVEEHEPFLRQNFSAESVLDVVMGLQAECDSSGARILQRYISFRQFARITNSITRRSGVADPADSLNLDPREVEGYLEEMLLLCQRSEEYNQFMLSKMLEAVAPKSLGASRENAFRGGHFNMAVRELVSYYVAIEEYYMEHAVGKAIEIREASQGGLTTSLVDDAFFVLQKCGRRALATSNTACVCAVLGQLNNLLTAAVYPELHSKLQNVAPKLLAAEAEAADESMAPIAAAAAATKAATEAAYINDAEISSGYVLKLRSELEDVAADIWGGGSSGGGGSEREQIRSVLSDLAKTSGDFKQLAAWALASLTSALMTRIRSPLDEVAAVSYVLTEAQYAANEAGDTWVQAVLGELGRALYSLQPLLTANNYDLLVSLLLEDVASRIDAILATRRFNQLGGLQLDRDVRALIAYAADLTQRPVREKFAQLSQKATILSLEAAEEIMEYWGDNAGPMNWRLSADDIRAVLRQREDFMSDDIAGLLL